MELDKSEAAFRLVRALEARNIHVEEDRDDRVSLGMLSNTTTTTVPGGGYSRPRTAGLGSR
jgi:hypothetical protein